MRERGIEEILREHPVFKDFDEETLQLLVGCARNEHFPAGTMIFSEGDPADRLFVLRKGDVAVEIAAPARAPLIVETMHAGDILAWAWMVPPYRCMSDARAQTEVSAVTLDAACLRGKCEENPVLGYAMFKQFLPLVARRVRSLRLQLLDLYGSERV